jgi:hypothetical protein
MLWKYCEKQREGGIVVGKRTLLLPMMRRAPMGAKIMPMMRSVGRTVFGVRIGCQAFSRCCLNAVSMQCTQREVSSEDRKDALAGRFQLVFSFLGVSPSEFEACWELFARRKRAMIVGGGGGWRRDGLITQRSTSGGSGQLGFG